MAEKSDISYWKHAEIDKIADALFQKISDEQADWAWEVEFHEGDEESKLGAHWTLAGESKKHKLSIMMYLGFVPWFTRWKLYFTKDGKEYSCLAEMFQKLPSSKRLEIKLDEIARVIKKKEDVKAKRVSKEYEQGERQKAKKVIRSLGR